MTCINFHLTPFDPDPFFDESDYDGEDEHFELGNLVTSYEDILSVEERPLHQTEASLAAAYWSAF